jgi:crotonobetainyl-CoA:carnitine CoA-transferase CaiB-like acyl-CoA transferase
VRSVAEAAGTAWAAQRGAIASVDDRKGDTIRIPQAPWRFSGATAAVRGAPAYRGEHNREVLGSLLGLDGDELDRLEAAGVLSSRVPGGAPR